MILFIIISLTELQVAETFTVVNRNRQVGPNLKKLPNT